MLVLSAIAVFGSAGQAAAETRSLKIHFVHTGEKVNVVYKRNGRYDAKGLRQLSNVLRDWRRNEPTKMDPRLFDLLWEVYRQSGATSYITAVSGYRSPQTNSMLRSRSKGVAKESQHTRGTAVDFYIPGVPLKRLREIGIKLQAGGVGFYPRSGSPFVHMDVAGVRAWPRMSRNDLARLFPDGKTVHIPADGKPLPGYQQALAEYKQRLRSGNNPIMVAEEKNPTRSKNLFAMLFGGGDEDEVEDLPAPEERPAVVRQEAPAAPEPAPVVTAREPTLIATALPGVEGAAAPVPQARPSLSPADNSLAVALYSPARNAAEDALSQVASGVPVPTQAATDAFPDLASMKIPVPTLLGTRGLPGDAEASNLMTASVDPRAIIDDSLNVPVPIARPAVAEALLANAQSEIEAEADQIEQAILSPEAAEALEMSNQAVPAEMAAPAVVTPSARPVTAEAPAVQVAAIAPRPAHAYVKPQGQFGDMFDSPPVAENGVEAGLPAKGGRPSAIDAEQARLAMYGGTRLTKTMIAEWALSQERSDSVNKPVKAPRVVTRTLAQPATGLSVGFSQAPVQVDPGRFGNP